MAPRSKKVVPTVILAVDPGEAAGIALYVNGSLAYSKAINGRYWSSLSQEIRRAVEETAIWDVERRLWLCVIEDGFSRGIGAKTLDRRRGKAEAAAEAVGIVNFQYLSPSKWQAYFGYRRGEDSKLFSCAHARIILQREPADHNEADAVMIGKYALDLLKIPG